MTRWRKRGLFSVIIIIDQTIQYKEKIDPQS